MNVSQLADIATFLGVPLALAAFLTEKALERTEREYGTNHARDEKHLAYLTSSIEHPRLGLYDMQLPSDLELGPLERVQQFAMFDILVSLLERAFLMYADESTRIKRRQWEGWL
jgi:hypothetical protein